MVNSMIKNGILQENEKTANKIAAKVMRVTFLVFTLIYLLNIFHVFTVDEPVMTIAYIGGSILLFLPTVFTNVLKWEKEFIFFQKD